LRLQPREEVARTAAQAQVENGEALAKQGRIVDALAAFRRAQALYEALSIEANSWNSLCWHGALAGRPELVIDACDRAVGSAAEDLKPFFQDSRGVARATLGRRAEAIEDFKSFIAWTGKSPAYETYRLRREAWLRDLEAGGNPFDAATLDALKREE
jgi:tetratricopeptide (TPR) repeat protein